MAKNSMGSLVRPDQKDSNKQSYPKKGAEDSIPTGKGKAKAAPPKMDKMMGKRAPMTSKRAP